MRNAFGHGKGDAKLTDEALIEGLTVMTSPTILSEKSLKQSAIDSAKSASRMMFTALALVFGVLTKERIEDLGVEGKKHVAMIATKLDEDGVESVLPGFKNLEPEALAKVQEKITTLILDVDALKMDVSMLKKDVLEAKNDVSALKKDVSEEKQERKAVVSNLQNQINEQRLKQQEVQRQIDEIEEKRRRRSLEKEKQMAAMNETLAALQEKQEQTNEKQEQTNEKQQQINEEHEQIIAEFGARLSTCERFDKDAKEKLSRINKRLCQQSRNISVHREELRKNRDETATSEQESEEMRTQLSAVVSNVEELQEREAVLQARYCEREEQMVMLQEANLQALASLEAKGAEWRELSETLARVSGDTNQAVATSNLALSKAADAESSSSAAAVAATRAEENAAGAATTATTIASDVHTAAHAAVKAASAPLKHKMAALAADMADDRQKNGKRADAAEAFSAQLAQQQQGMGMVVENLLIGANITQVRLDQTEWAVARLQDQNIEEFEI